MTTAYDSAETVDAYGRARSAWLSARDAAAYQRMRALLLIDDGRPIRQRAEAAVAVLVRHVQRTEAVRCIVQPVPDVEAVWILHGAVSARLEADAVAGRVLEEGVIHG